ncbi:MAG: haloacid dehalogenase type II [Rhizobiales bacterium]|nr:haloacid dehalogenase type II [Hyphomicrobiales bacterium]
MTKLEGIKACVFDAYGTLFDVHGPVSKLAAEIGPKADELSKLWRQKQLEYSWLRSLMGVHADFWKVTGDALDYALAACGIEDPGLKDELMVFYLKLDAYPDAADTLTAVRAKGKRTAILSNGSPSMLDSAVRAAGLEKLIEMVLSVEDVGIYKPSRRVYRHAQHKLGFADALSICFVSANAWDSHGASQFGFQVVHVDVNGSPDERLPGKPSRRISALRELCDLV